MEFDFEGDTIALIQDYCSVVTIINIYTKKILEVDIDKSNKDKPTCIRWGKNHPILGIGTLIGLIYYYNKKSDKIYPLSFNHNKSVTTADWNDEGNLATGDENSSLSVTNKQGEPILQNATLKSDPKMVKWARQKTNENKNSYTTISTVLNNKTILIYDIKKKLNPIELALDSDYGNIVTYQWFGDGYIAIGFSKGYISIISTHMNEIKNEVHSMQPFKTGLDDLNVCEEVNRIAIAGENSVKIFDTNLWSEIVEEKIEISNQAGRISKIQWSSTGHILIISTYLGSIFAFNVIVNDVYAVHSKK
jgi:WD repeat-containing protein 19